MVGTDKFKEARILELENHPFFIATPFVPQGNSTIESPNKLVTGFLKPPRAYTRIAVFFINLNPWEKRQSLPGQPD
jgi:CTP synthase (UTP-ammonia lyase)